MVPGLHLALAAFNTLPHSNLTRRMEHVIIGIVRRKGKAHECQDWPQAPRPVLPAQG